MAPPTYGDLGKAAKDIFSKGYSKWLFNIHVPQQLNLNSVKNALLLSLIDVISDYGEWKLEAKTKTDSGVEFTTSGSHSDKGIISGSLETKYKYSDLGKLSLSKILYIYTSF